MILYQSSQNRHPSHQKSITHQPPHLLLIRHARSEVQSAIWRAIKGEEQANHNPINDKNAMIKECGINDSMRLGLWLNREHDDVTRIIHSDTYRAWHTCNLATIVSGKRELVGITENPLCSERDWTSLIKLPKSQLDSFNQSRKIDPFNTETPDGVKLIDIVKNAQALLEELIKQSGKTIVFTHGEFIYATLAFLLRMNAKDYVEFFSNQNNRVDNCGVLELISDSEAKTSASLYTHYRIFNPLITGDPQQFIKI